MLSIYNCVSKPTTTDYTKLKKTLRRTTAGYGAALSTTYFITQGSDQGLSVALGALSSYTYICLLSDHVDNIEHSRFQKELLAPISAAAFEMSWNQAPFSFDFDYGSTFIGFLAYKCALSTVLYDIVRDMLIEGEQSHDPIESREQD
jgi:hypothetical protein